MTTTVRTSRGLPWGSSIIQGIITPDGYGNADDLVKGINTRAAMRQAGLDWDVELSDIVTVPQMANGEPVVWDIPGRFAVTRKDTGQPVGVVGKRYQPLNSRRQAEFTDMLVTKGADTIAGVGATNDGGMDTKVWTVVEIPGEYRPFGMEDELLKVFLFTVNSFNGSTSFRSTLGAWRMACINGLHYQVKSLTTTWTIRHTASLDDQMHEAEEAIRRAAGWGEQLVADAEELIEIPVARHEATAIFDTLFPIPEPKFEDGKQLNTKAVTMATRRREGAEATWLHSDDLGNIRNTGYGLLQAVAEWNDWGRSYRSDPMDRVINRPINGTPLLNRTRELVTSLA